VNGCVQRQPINIDLNEKKEVKIDTERSGFGKRTRA